MKVAITGSSGALGLHLRALLQDRGVSHTPLTRQQWDMRSWADEKQISDLTAGADVLVHAAASLPPVGSVKEVFDTNLRATINLANWAYRTKVHFVFISSGSVYANPHQKAIIETDRVGPGDLGGLYASSKRLAEASLAEFAAMGLELTVLRPSSVYGVGISRNALVWRFLEAASTGGPISFHGGKNAINFLHLHDLARAVLMATENKAIGTFNVAANAPSRIAYLAQCAADLFDTTAVQRPQAADNEAYTRFDFDLTAARSVLRYEPIISLPQGLNMMSYKTFLPSESTAHLRNTSLR